MFPEEIPTLPPLKQNARYAMRPREPMAHGRYRPRPAHAAQVSFRLVDETGLHCEPAAAVAGKAANPLVEAEVAPREPVSRPRNPPRPEMTELPSDGSLHHLSPSERMRLRRIR